MPSAKPYKAVLYRHSAANLSSYISRKGYRLPPTLSYLPGTSIWIWILELLGESKEQKRQTLSETLLTTTETDSKNNQAGEPSELWRNAQFWPISDLIS